MVKVKRNSVVDYLGFRYKVCDVIGSRIYIKPAMKKGGKDCIRQVKTSDIGKVSKHTIK